MRTASGGAAMMNTAPLRRISPFFKPEVSHEHPLDRVATRLKNAREQLLAKEKGLFRARDALSAERRRMPWMGLNKCSRAAAS
jgi:hypothetical protein